MDYNNVREKWNLEMWMERVNKVEDKVAKFVVSKKLDHSIDEVLIRNYARISICMQEIITLLDNGYPDGALSISRTVYEIMIITQFLCEKVKKDSTDCILEQYFTDQNVKSYHNLKLLYEDVSSQSESQNILDEKIDELDIKLNEIKKKYGKINTEYWWAKPAFEKGGSLNFSKIEKSVNDNFMLRMLYKRACISIHASSMGAFALLGRKNEEGNLIYTTPTDQGFEAPILLAMGSHDIFVELLCNQWGWSVTELLADVTNEYEKYMAQILKPKDNTASS